MNAEIKEIKIDDIHGASYNPRDISNQELTKLKNNIGEFGIVDPIIVNLRNNRIVGGHQRYKALQAQGVTDLYMLMIGNIGWVFNDLDLDIPDEDSEKILNLSLNNISGEWNESQLSKVLQDLKSRQVNYKLSGFDDIDLERLKIDTEVLFEENIIGNSWDKFKKAQGDEDWKDKYNKDEEEPVEEEEEQAEEELSEEEELQQLNEGIIREDDAVVFLEEVPCPKCGTVITLDMFEENYYDRIDEL